MSSSPSAQGSQGPRRELSHLFPLWLEGKLGKGPGGACNVFSQPFWCLRLVPGPGGRGSWDLWIKAF